MFKVTPDPPETENASPSDSSELCEAAQRARDHYPQPPFDKSRLAHVVPVNIFTVVPGLSTETLLANACETLASANVLVSDLAFEVEGSCRNVALAIQQMIELSQLLVNEALEQVAPAG
ncbi:DUF6124 family protein [Pseudomonas fluorescens]|uniref:DUF3077 domain-containing protein n=1 Tax=Pseudomonas fluorescens TaxID=294 RepID=A0A5E7FR43_PSEFL|nr:DUF6124 family protein [Pseudomonas fluorescens]VVO41806.1 hypothetical protein PS723_05928 [Pseudomonas fluorescens]